MGLRAQRGDAAAGRPGGGDGALHTGDGALMVLWLGFVSLAASYLLFGRGIAGVSVATATTLSLAEPLTAATLGIVILDEDVTGLAIAGMVLVFAGLAFLAIAKQDARMSPIMQALYEGRRADAEAAAVDADLDIFEAAALGRHPRVAELLRGDESLAQAWSDDGFTALHYACFFGHPDCTITLLDAGALIDEPSRNDMGVRPINAAAAGQHAFDHVVVLVTRGADINGRQASGHTALDEARLRNDQQLVDLLTVRGATG